MRVATSLTVSAGLVLGLLLYSPPADAGRRDGIKIQGCISDDPSITGAVGYVDDIKGQLKNLPNISYGKNRRQRRRVHRRMDKMLGKMRWECVRSRCWVRNGLRKGRLCMDHWIYWFKYDFCDLVGEVAQAYGGVSGLKKDQLLRFNYAAARLCRESGRNTSLPLRR